MTVEVSGYKDLDADSATTGGEADAILDAMEGESEAMRAFRAEGWLWEDKSLETSHRHDTLVYGRVAAETDKAYLVTQLGAEYKTDEVDANDPQTDWVPKSVVRVYKPAEGGIDATGPQAFLGDYADE